MVRRKSASSDSEIFHDDPKMAADELDAILYFIHRRYTEHGLGAEAPRITAFWIALMSIAS